MATLSSPTLQKLITNVRNLLNQADRNNSFWSDEELVEYINEGVRMYFAEITNNNEGQFGAVTTLSTTANTETVALPSDCFEVRALYRLAGSDYLLLDYNNSLNEDYTSDTDSGSLYRPSYFLRGNNIVLRPIPGATESGVLRLEYISFPETLVNGGDSLTAQVSPIFKQLIEMYAVYKAKLKESLVQGVSVHGVAKENLLDIYSQFQDATGMRTKVRSYIEPFDP